MKTIPLTQGYFAKVDDEDYEKLAIYRWHSNIKKVTNGIVVRACRTIRTNGKRTSLYMTRFILNPPINKYVDHINRNTLDNRKINLRFCSNAENSRNRGTRFNSSSGYKGVSWSKQDQQWRVRVYRDYQLVYQELFEDKKEAVLAYNKMVKIYHKDFAKTNEI